MHTLEGINIEERLRSMEPAAQLAFGIFLLERAIPWFLRWQAEVNSSGGGDLRAALASCWARLEVSSNRKAAFVSVAECERLLPESEGSVSIYTSAAIDAVDIACNVLQFLDTGDLSLIVSSAASRRDTIDIYIQSSLGMDPSEPSFETDILSHPMMQAELKAMHSELAMLGSPDTTRIGVLQVALRYVTSERFQRLHSLA